MRRTLLAFLTAILLLAGFSLPAYGAEDPGGRLEVLIRMDYRESPAVLLERGLTLTLTGRESGSAAVTLTGKDTKESLDLGGGAGVDITYLNPEDAPVGGNDRVGFVMLAFSGLPSHDEYTVSLVGKGFSSFTSQKLAVDSFVPRLYVSSHSGGFALGDINGDRVIDQADLDQVSGAQGTSSAASDLNGDGKVDIVDLALVHHNMLQAGREAEVFEGALVVDGLLEMDTMEKALEKSGVQLEGGSLDDLFADNGQRVHISAGEGDLEFPIVFEKPTVMSAVNVVSPAVSGALEAGTVRVEYGDGTTQDNPFDNSAPAGVHATQRQLGDSTVTIPLGNRVPVKKITITVEKVYGEDGKATYMVVEKIEFLRDIIPDNLDLGASVPQNVFAQAGVGQATLSWRPVDNVDGYIVKYGEKPNALIKQQKVGRNEAVISGLKNLTTYYFTVSAYNGDWTGDPSAVVSCVPIPGQAPLPPDNLSLSPADSAITVNWKTAEDAEFYDVYYKESAASEFQRVAEAITATSFTVEKLTNGVSYDFYVRAGNQIGYSKPSLTATGEPEEDKIIIPTLPTKNRIPNSAITKVTMESPGNISAEYEGKFDISWVYDGDFETHWTAASWGKSSRFTFEFDE